jgi:hypothetical protein
MTAVKRVEPPRRSRTRRRRGHDPAQAQSRASGTSAQATRPLAEYAAKELGYKRVITLANDFAF